MKSAFDFQPFRMHLFYSKIEIDNRNENEKIYPRQLLDVEFKKKKKTISITNHSQTNTNEKIK